MKAYPVSLLQGVSLHSLIRLMSENKITNKDAYERYREKYPHVSYEAFCETLIKNVSKSDKSISKATLKKSLLDHESYAIFAKCKIKKSNIDKYRDEVQKKIKDGKVDFLNTKIKIANRDMYSVLYELNIDISHLKKTNFSVNHINWHDIEKIINRLKNNEITMGDFIRFIREHYKNDIGVTTIKYKLRENNFKKTMLNYSEPILFDMLKSQKFSNDIKRNNDTTISHNDFKTYSFGELAYYTGLSLHKVYLAYNKAIKEDSSIIEWARLINKHNIQCLDYKLENINELRNDLEKFSIKDVSVKYKIPISTLKDWMNKK